MKRIIALLMCVALIFASLPTLATDAPKGLTYVIENGEVTITGYTQELEVDSTIPEEIDGKPVTKISEFAFRDSNIEKIHIPKTVTSIGEGVFFGCSKLLWIDVDLRNEVYDCISGLTTKDGKTVLKYYQPFGGTESMTGDSNTLATTVEHLGYGAFAGTAWKILNLANIETLSDYAFLNCIAGTFHFSSVKNIGEGTFMNAQINDKAYFGAVEKVGSKAFENCKGELYFYCDAPDFAADSFGGENTPSIHYAKGTTGWEKVDGATEFEPTQYTVSFIQTFEDTGLAADFFARVNVYEGLTMCNNNMPKFPEVEGYLAKPCVETFSAPVLRNFSCQIFYADNRPRTVTFIDSYNGEILGTATAERFSNIVKTVEFPEHLEHEGYNFNGWSFMSYIIDFETTCIDIDRDIDIYAEYEVILFEVVFIDSLSPEYPIMQCMATYGTDVGFPNAPNHDGYTFIGWDKDGKNILEDTTITALYKRTYELGDVNCDSLLNTGDAVIILQYHVGVVKLTDQQKSLADFNNDKEINSGDAVAVLIHCVHEKA